MKRIQEYIGLNESINYVRTALMLLIMLVCFNQAYSNSSNNKLTPDTTIHINLNELELAHDSLFSLKFIYGRYGEIEDSLLEVEISQVALVADSIDEQVVYKKTFSFSNNTFFLFKIAYAGYQEVSHSFEVTGLSTLDRATIIPFRKEKPKKVINSQLSDKAEVEKKRQANKEKKQGRSHKQDVESESDANSKVEKIIEEQKETAIEEKAFVFVGTIYEEGTKIRLPNVRVIIQDRRKRNKQHVGITKTDGIFRDTVKGYKLNNLLSFEIYLKKEGYISKSFVFEEVLKEYGEVDLEEYLKKIRLTKAEVGVEIGKAANINPIYFDLDKSNLRRNAKKELNKIISILKEEPSLEIELSSHTDSRANDAYNLALSNRRAKSVENYFISNGINEARLISVGFGESQLINKCANNVECTEEEHEQNRRTEFKIVKIGSKKRIANQLSRLGGSSKSLSPIPIIIAGTINDDIGSLRDVEIIIRDRKDKSNEYRTLSNVDGKFSKAIGSIKPGEELNLEIVLRKKDYITKSFRLKKKIAEKTTINLGSYFDDFKLTKLRINAEIGKAANIDPIYFELDKAEIGLEAATELDKIALILSEKHSITIELSSHSDSRGDDAYNLKLSKRRANAAMIYLVSQGISYGRITAVGYGEQKLLNGCSNGVECSEEEHDQNRRIEFKITGL